MSGYILVGGACNKCGKGTYKYGNNNTTSCTNCASERYQDENG